MSAYVGQRTSGMRDVHGCSSIAAWFASQTSVGVQSATTYCSLSPGSASVLSHRVIHSGACAGTCFCQKPFVSAPFGKRWRFSGRPSRYGRIVGAIDA